MRLIDDKQDCELVAAGRWLARWSERYAPWRLTVLGDDLYSHQPFCQAIRDQGGLFLMAFPRTRHYQLWIA